jgi:hypothetical protein
VLNVELSPPELGSVTYFVPIVVMNDFEGGTEQEEEEEQEGQGGEASNPQGDSDGEGQSGDY